MFKVSNLIIFFLLFSFIGAVFAQDASGVNSQLISDSQLKNIEIVEENRFYSAIKANDRHFLLDLGSRLAFGQSDINITDKQKKADAIYVLAELQIKNNSHAIAFLLFDHSIFSDDYLDEKYRWNILAALFDLLKKNQGKEYKEHLGRKILAEMLKKDIRPRPELADLLVNAVAKDLGDTNLELQFYLFELNFKKIIEEFQNGRINYKAGQRVVYEYVKDFYSLPDAVNSTNNSPDGLKTIPVAILRHWYIRDLIKSIEKSGLTSDEKADLVAALVWRTQSRSTSKMFSEILGWAEPLLFIPVDKYEVNQSQISVLLPSLNNKEYWPYKKSREEVFKHIEIRSTKYKDWYTRFSLGMFRSREYLDLGQFDLANEEIQYLEKNPVPSSLLGPNFSRAMSVITLLFRHKYFQSTGAYYQATNLITKIDSEIVWFRDQFLSEFPSMIGYVGSFAKYYEFKLEVGNPKDVIPELELLIQKLGPPSNQNDNNDSARAQLYAVLSSANFKSGNYDLGYKNRLMGYEAELRSGEVNFSTALRRFYENIRVIVDVDKYEFDVFGDAKSNIELAGEINSRGERALHKIEYELNKVVVDSSLKLLKDLQAGKKNKNQLLKMHCSEVSLAAEINADQLIKYGNYEASSSLLSAMYFYNSCAGDDVYAAYYAKRHINLMQEVRFSLSKASGILNQFTENISDQLSKYADNFYEIGDFDSASTTLRIIKENQFYDFVRRDAGSAFTYSRLYFSNDEKAIHEKIDRILDEIEVVQKRIKVLNSPKDSEEINFLERAISIKRDELTKLKVGLRAMLKDSSLKARGVSKKSIYVRASDEAVIEYSITKDSVVLYVHLIGDVKKYEFRVSRTELRNLILQLQKRLVANKTEAILDISEISRYLMVDKVVELKAAGISRIKLLTSDYLGLIPFSLLESKNTALGDLFAIQIVGLVAKSAQRVGANSTSVFGATRGYKKFSPLPYVREEVEFINNISLKNKKISRSNIFLDKNFTKDSLVSAYNSGTSFIHVATHYDPVRSQDSSGQLLMGDGSLLSLNELLRSLKRNEGVRLVTLSACETGSFYPGEGISSLEGLSNIFVINGAENVLGTLWAVSDAATSDFMKVFYFLLNQNVPPEEALRLTQLVFKTANLKHIEKYMSTDDALLFNGFKDKLSVYLKPYYWAGFQLISQ